MIFFKLEKGTKLENYPGKFGTYTNIVVENSVPAVKVVGIKKAKL